MCTVTFIPTVDNQFIFTSNRDEAPNRSASTLVRANKYGKTLLFPQDTGAHGSWIVISDSDQLVCILNGAFERHDRQPPYRLSRGIMAMEFFEYDDVEHFLKLYQFENIEPFTMIIYDRGRLHEVRWDYSQYHHSEYATDQMKLWASATLYDDVLQEKRQQWFKDWRSNTVEVNQHSILDFHRHGGEGNPLSDVVMNYHEIVKTTSITSILHTDKEMSMRFENLEIIQVSNDTMPLTTP